MSGITSMAESAGLGTEWQDDSGGYIQFAVVNPDGTHLHRLRVIPFASNGNYNAPAGGQEANLNDTAANFVALAIPLFGTTTTILPVAAYQVITGGGGVQPLAFSFANTITSPGTSGGAFLDSACQLSISAHGSDFSRWGLHLLGISASFWGAPQRTLAALGGGAASQLAEYLISARTGPGFGGHGAGLNTAVVTHSGAALVAPAYFLTATNKRMRRRLKIA